MPFVADLRLRLLASRVASGCRQLGMLLLGWTLLSAHVGTNQVVFEGRAGGYPVRVMIDPPGVVPAQVPITVRVLEGTPTRVTVRAAQWNVGTKGAPPAEAAAIVPGENGLWAHDLWIMTSASYAVYVAVEGPAGNGSVLVPMQTSATRMLGMKRGMGVMLVALGTLLVAGMLTIIGAAAREGTLAAGEAPSPTRLRRGRVAMGAGAVILSLALMGGRAWWSAEESWYKRRMQQPIAMTASVSTLSDAASGSILTMAVTDSLWRTNRLGQLLPDHGKLMHLFLARIDQPELVIAHLHPLRVQADTFVTRVPPMPAGSYLLFGDVLFDSGRQRTLVDTVALSAPDVPGTGTGAGSGVPAALPVLDADDAWRVMAAVSLGSAAPLAGGGTLTLRADSPPTEKRDLRLVVDVVEQDGSRSTLEPYMGMQGHAMVLRADAGVFLHLHPMGTASMTAQAQLARLERGDSTARDAASLQVALDAEMSHAAHGGMPGSESSALAFPFAFPSAGNYVVFVQVKRRGLVETAAFRVTVPARTTN